MLNSSGGLTYYFITHVISMSSKWTFQFTNNIIIVMWLSNNVFLLLSHVK